MEPEINTLIRNFASISIEFRDAYKYSIPPHTISAEGSTQPEVCGMIIPIKGKAKFVIDNTTFEIEPGVILHAAPNMSLKKEVMGKSRWEYVLIHYKIVGNEIEKQYFEQKSFTITTGNSPNLLKLVHQLCLNAIKVENISILRNKVLFYSILEELLQLAQRNFYGSDEDIISFALKYIHNHFGQSLTVAELSNLLDMDSRKFSYVFQKCVGMCPHGYLTRYRISKAKELLVIQEGPIGEIANLVGYEDSFYFSRIFKKYTGLAPTEFRNSFRKNP